MAHSDTMVQETHDLLAEYASARKDWATHAVEDNEFRNGKQWTDKQIKLLRRRNQEPLVVNVIHSAVEQAKALMSTNKPKFQSTGRESSDVKAGKIFSDIMTWIWDHSNGNTVLKQAIDDYYVMGMGVLYTYMDMNADFGKGEVMLSSVNPLDVYFDPQCQDPFARDASSIIVAKKVMQSQILSSYPEFEESIISASQTNYVSNVDASRGMISNEITSRTDISLQSEYADKDRELELIERFYKTSIMMRRIFDPQSNDERILNDEEYESYLKEPAFIVKDANGVRAVTEEQQVSQLIEMYTEFGETYHMMTDPMSGQPFPMKGEEHPPEVNPNPPGLENPTSGAQPIPGSTVELKPVEKRELVGKGAIQVYEISVDRVEQCVLVGDVKLFSVTLPVEEYPIVPIMNGFNRNPYPLSDVRKVRGIQEYINKVRSLIVAHASSSTNVKLLIPRGSMDKRKLEEEWAKAGTAVIEFDPELGQPIVASPIPLPNELYKNESDAKADVERILGIYALMQGDQGAAPQTYKGTIALDEFGQRRIKSKKDDVESSINELAKRVVQMVQAVYTDQKVIRLLQPNSAPREVQLNQAIYDEISGEFLGRINDITVGKYDIIMVSGSTLPSNRWARFEYYMQLYQAGLIDQIEVLKQTDVADMEGVLERKDQVMQMQGTIQQLQETIKNLEGDLQTAQRESLHDRKRVEVKEFEARIAKLEAKIEAATKLYETRASDELKKLKEALSMPDNKQRQLNEGLLGLDSVNAEISN